MGEFGNWLIIQGSKLSSCGRLCPVQDRRQCTWFKIAQSTGKDPMDTVREDFRTIPSIARQIREKHCLGVIRKSPGWEKAVYNPKTGEIEKR